MKQLLLYKQLDLVAQLITIIVSIIITESSKDHFAFIIIYIAVCLVQLVSCLLNRLFLPRRLRVQSRRFSEIFLLMIWSALLVFVTGYYNPIVMFIAGVILLPSPFFAIIYLVNSVQEVRVIRRWIQHGLGLNLFPENQNPGPHIENE